MFKVGDVVEHNALGIAQACYGNAGCCPAEVESCNIATGSFKIKGRAAIFSIGYWQLSTRQLAAQNTPAPAPAPSPGLTTHSGFVVGDLVEWIPYVRVNRQAGLPTAGPHCRANPTHPGGVSILDLGSQRISDIREFDPSQPGNICAWFSCGCTAALAAIQKVQGQVQPHYTALPPVVGRMTGSAPNTQNLPKPPFAHWAEKGVMAMLGAPKPDGRTCTKCGRGMSATLDVYYGRDPKIAALCSGCRPRGS